MATKKKVEAPVAEETQAAAPVTPVETSVAEETQAAAPVTPVEAPKMVKIMVPSDPLCEDSDSIFVSVNGMNYQIKRGVEVEVPDFIAEVYLRSVEGDVKALETARRIREQMAQRKAI